MSKTDPWGGLAPSVPADVAVPAPTPAPEPPVAPGDLLALEDALMAAPAPKPSLRPVVQPSPDQEAALNTVWGVIQAIQEGTHDGPPVVVWVGNAGTGKTTCMRLLEQALEHQGTWVEWMAPTGKAASRLRDVLGGGVEVTTIHARLYGAPAEMGICPRCGAECANLAVSAAELTALGAYWQCSACSAQFDPAVDSPPTVRLAFAPAKADEDGNVMICNPGAVLVCDEASMVNDTTYADILAALPSRATVIFLGDDGQVPPVDGVWGPDFANPTVKLTQVHRQAAGSMIIQAATIARTTGDVNKLFKMSGADYAVNREASMTDAANWLVQQRQQDVDATLVTYTNADRQTLNDLVRRGLGLYDKARQQGMPVTAGDRLLITANNRDANIMNGEVFKIASVEQHPNVEHEGVLVVKLAEKPDREFYLLAQAVGIDTASFRFHRKRYVRAWERAEAKLGIGNVREDNSRLDPGKFLCVDYGECLTVHKSQGSQWAAVGFVFGRSLWGMYYKERPNFQRLVYTALTRAAKKLYMFVIKK